MDCRRTTASARSPWTRWVLAAWLCVVLAAGVSPLAQATDWERVCTAGGESLWVPSPTADDGQAAVHALDCALCLPALAPAPPSSSAALAAQAQVGPSTLTYRQPPRQSSALLPPVRAPPHSARG